MRARSFFLAILSLFAGIGLCLGQQAAPQKHQSHLYRTTLTIAGGGGGFVLGVFAGIGIFDDAINATQKVTMTAVVTTAAGGVGGYFLGRWLDRRRNDVTWTPGTMRNELDWNLLRMQLPADIRNSIHDDLRLNRTGRLLQAQIADLQRSLGISMEPGN